MSGRRTRAGRTRPRLAVGQVLASAWHAGLASAGRILLVAIVISSIAAVVETVLHEFIDRADLPAAALADVGVSGVNLLGLVILSGVLSQVVGEAGHGRRPVPMGELLRSLPWARLVVADLVVALLVTVGLVAFVIPGLIVLTLLAVVGPVIEIEHRPVRSALRRSAHLVRHHFWAVALLATLPVMIADEIPAALRDGAGPLEIVVFLAIRGIGEAVVEAVVGVVLVELTYRLILADRTRSAEAEAAQA